MAKCESSSKAISPGITTCYECEVASLTSVSLVVRTSCFRKGKPVSDDCLGSVKRKCQYARATQGK